MKYLALPLITLLNILSLTTSGQHHAFQLATGVGGIGGSNHEGMIFSFEPRVNLHEFSDKSSISIGSCMGIGPSFPNHSSKIPYRSYALIPQLGAIYNFPVTVNYTFGNGATPRAFSLFGGSAGLGYAFHKADRWVDPAPGVDTTTVLAQGLICDAKFNFPIGNSCWSLHATYMFNFSQHNPDLPSINSLSLQYTFGYRVFNRERRPARPPRQRYEHDRAYYKEIDRQKKAEMKNKRKRVRSEEKETT